jgi:hypothetical protein
MKYSELKACIAADYKTCNFHSDADWADPVVGKSTDGTTRFTLTNANVEICKLACLQATDFHCRSFVIVQTTCFLKSSAV